MLPAHILATLAAAPVVGFSGSRAPAAASRTSVRLAAAAIPASVPVVVGCAAGIDQQARQLFPAARVFYAAAYGTGRGSFAARSIACVQACAGGVWASFPAGPAPAGLRPSSSGSACFAGYGSGSWAGLAYAIGSGLSAIVFLPAGSVPPASFGLVSAGQGWYFAAAPARQLTLF